MADTEAARAFSERLPLTLDMSDLNANEKHADLAQSLPADASKPGTIHCGDITLYGARTGLWVIDRLSPPIDQC